MSDDHDERRRRDEQQRSAPGTPTHSDAVAPGQVSRSSQLRRRANPEPSPFVAAMRRIASETSLQREAPPVADPTPSTPVQAKTSDATAPSTQDAAPIHELADQGLSSAAGTLPHLDEHRRRDEQEPFVPATHTQSDAVAPGQVSRSGQLLRRANPEPSPFVAAMRSIASETSLQREALLQRQTPPVADVADPTPSTPVQLRSAEPRPRDDGAGEVDDHLRAAMGLARRPPAADAPKAAESESLVPSDGDAKPALEKLAPHGVPALATGAASDDHVHEAAHRGVTGAGSALPHGDAIQRAFGRHDVSSVKAHVGGEAATASRAIGAEAYATGNQVAFAAAPSLHTAAHEAAHVVQQRAGVHLKGGVGETGDQYERHANDVADAVVQGKSAETLLDQYATGSSSRATAVQRQEATSGPSPIAATATSAPAPAPEREATSSAAPDAGSPAAAPAVEPATKLTPDDVAELILRRPDSRDDFLQWAERVGGAVYRDKILAAVEKHRGAASALPPAPATAASAMPSAAVAAATPASNSSTSPARAPSLAAAGIAVPRSASTVEPHAAPQQAPSAVGQAAPPPTRVAPIPTPEHAATAPAAPVSKSGPVTVANPSDESLAVMATQLHNPRATKIVTDLAAAVALAKGVPIDRTRKEFKGEERESLVAAIGGLRAEVLALTGADPQTVAFKAAVNHKLEALSPYHSQVNIRTIETGPFTTCNVTSLAMSLETIGKNADSYKTSKRPQIVAVARMYRADIAKATLPSHGTDPVWDSLRGLRLPDFMELAAIANTLHGSEPTEAEIKQAAIYAAITKTHLDFLASIAADFGAHALARTTQFDGHAKDLENFAQDHHSATDTLVDMRNKLEANPHDETLKTMYETLRTKPGNQINGGEIEKRLPLRAYKETIIKEVAPHLDAGAGVISGTWNHFTHAYQIASEHIVVQDPGQYSRSQRKLLWDEARALQYFWNYLVIT